MTLLELLIAVSIFSVLGGTLVMLLAQAVRAWRTGEARRESYEEAQTILRIVREDLRNVFAANPVTAGNLPRARFLADYDAMSRQRLSFVRTLPYETRHPFATLAGTQLGAMGDLDGEDDKKEAFAGDLRSTGGLLEVVYAFHPTREDTLVRAARAPLGGPGSLFALEVVDDALAFDPMARVVSTRVLHLGWRFFVQTSETWRGEVPLKDPENGDSGPADEWDSTRSLIEPAEDLDEDVFRFWRSEVSITNLDDDVVPERVEITLVVAENPPAGAWTLLEKGLLPDGKEVFVIDGRPFREKLPWVRIGREWLRCRYESDNRLSVEPRGRGLRGTEPLKHPAGTVVQVGRTFTMVVDIPAVLESWHE